MLTGVSPPLGRFSGHKLLAPPLSPLWADTYPVLVSQSQKRRGQMQGVVGEGGDRLTGQGTGDPAPTVSQPCGFGQVPFLSEPQRPHLEMGMI